MAHPERIHTHTEHHTTDRRSGGSTALIAVAVIIGLAAILWFLFAGADNTTAVAPVSEETNISVEAPEAAAPGVVVESESAAPAADAEPAPAPAGDAEGSVTTTTGN
jgi:cytoskeletal protein RodZ